MHNPIVSVVGSCRVHNPMRALRNAGFVKLNNERLRDFCHSSREALQKIRIANNRLEVPDELHFFVNGREKINDDNVRANFKKTDIFIIEISSVRRLTIDGYELQLNFFDDFFVKKFNLESWYFQLNEKARLAPLGHRVKHSPDAIGLPADVIKFASNVEMCFEKDEVIFDMIYRLSDYLKKPILFVGHFDVVKSDGSRVKDRVRLNSCIANAAAKNGQGFFNPSDVFNTESLALRDNNHWNYNFEINAGQYILENKINTMLN